MNRPAPAVKECLQCDIARFGPWKVYSNKCPECQIRCIANMMQDERTPLYERIEAQCGRSALRAIKEKVGLEIVRMRLLREGKAA